MFIFDQNSLRTHLGECFKAPVIKKRRIKERVKRQDINLLYVTVGCLKMMILPMVQCGTCKAWYHFECIGVFAGDISEDMY